MKKFFIIFISAILIGFIFNEFAFAARNSLEIEYPEIMGYEIEESGAPSLPSYVRYIYYFALGVSGFIALGVLTFAGFQYLTSAGMPEKMKQAKDRIKAAFLGLIILFGSILIIRTINTETGTLIKIAAPRIFVEELAPGVALCDQKVNLQRAWNSIESYKRESSLGEKERHKEIVSSIISEFMEHCYYVNYAQDIEGPDASSSWHLYLIPEKVDSGGRELRNTAGGTVENFKEVGALVTESASRKTTIVLNTENRGGVYEQQISPPKQIKPFVLNYTPDPYWGATAYQKVNYNKDYAQARESHCPPEYGSGQAGFTEHIQACKTPFPIASLKIEGDLVALIAKESTPDDIVVLTNNESNLNRFQELVKFEPCYWWGLLKCPVLAATELRLLSIKFY